MSFITAVVNVILAKVLIYQTAQEKQPTYSDYNISLAFKLSIAMFCNTGIIPLLANIKTDQWFTSGGLVADVFYKLLTVCFFSPIFSYVITVP